MVKAHGRRGFWVKAEKNSNAIHWPEFFPSALNSFSCSLIHGSINQEIITYQALQLVRVPTNVCKIKDDNTESYRNISYLLLLSSVSLMELHLYPENHQSVFFSQNREVFRVFSSLMNPATSVNWKNRLENRRFYANYIRRPRSAHSEVW